MKMLLIVGVLLIAAVVIGGIVYASKGEKEDFFSRYEASENPILIDVRTKEEYVSGHIDGAVNVNIYDTDFLAQVTKLAEGKEVFVYCRSGARSGEAASILSQAGFAVHSLEGGLLSYGGELVR